MILAIDPGQTAHGYIIVPDPMDLNPVEFGKVETSEMVLAITDTRHLTEIVIEKPVCRKWAGREVSDTAIMTGYLAGMTDLPVYLITRSKVRGCLKCTRGGDAAVKAFLIDMFSPGAPNHGKGTKDDPGFFYGFKSDIWQAFALAVAYCLIRNGGNVKDIDYLEENRIQ